MSADQKISALTAASPALLFDELPVHRSGANRKVTIGDLVGSYPIIKSVNFAATRFNWYLLTATALTVTFPATPAAGDKFWLKAARTSVLSVVTSRNGSNVNGAAADITISNFWTVECEYIDATEGWQVTWTPYLQGILDLSATTAGQIKFPSSANLSVDANTLDAYAEGTWTPTVDFGGASVGITYTTRTGRYRRVGAILDVECEIILSNKGSSSGAAHVTGLPFNDVGICGLNCGHVTALGAAIPLNQPPTLESVGGTIFMFYLAAGTLTSFLDTNFANTTAFTFSGAYNL